MTLDEALDEAHWKTSPRAKWQEARAKRYEWTYIARRWAGGDRISYSRVHDDLPEIEDRDTDFKMLIRHLDWKPA